MKRHRFLFSILLLIIAPVPFAWAELISSRMFSDHMVLQREMPVPVWGEGLAENGRVHVDFQGQHKTALGENGSWRVTLDPLTAGGPFEMRISDGSTTITYHDVMVGEVWLCSGQSNMQAAVKDLDEAAEIQAGTESRNWLRIFRTPRPFANQAWTWEKPSPEVLGHFSAVGFYFGESLQQNADLQAVPVGLIDSSFGGTRAEAWIDQETLDAEFAGEELHDSMFGFPPASMYNSMIKPLHPFAIRGILWYQGESNAGRPEQYARLLPTLIKRWRQEWESPDLPFIIVQLLNYAKEFDGAFFHPIREVQHQVWQSTPNTAMAVTIDVGDAEDVHPKNKRTVGERLGRVARALTYNENIAWAGPLYQSMSVEDERIRLTFTHISGELINRRGDQPMRSFTIAGKDGIFTEAIAVIEGDTVVVSSPEVSDPISVNYAWAADPPIDFYNAEGLPAFPFRTDVIQRE